MTKTPIESRNFTGFSAANDPPRAVGFCYRLKRWSADRYNHIETGRHHLPGNGVGDGEIAVGVEPAYANVLSVN